MKTHTRTPRHVFATLVATAAALLLGLTFAQTCTKPQEALAALNSQVMATGPHGETASPASDITLTDAELQQVKGMNATAAIVLHYGGNDWAKAQVDGLKARFAELNIKVIAVTDANFNPGKQVSDIETVMARNPDIIVSIPTDPVATASAYKKAADAGITLVFMDNVPNDLVAGKDYVSVVSADNYDNGVAAAHLMAENLNCAGDIGTVYHAADFFVTAQRYQGFKDTLAADYPDIHIVEEQGIGGPDFAGEAERSASAMLTRNRNLNGIWAVWDVPAEGVLSAIRSLGRDKMIVTTCDLGKNVAIDMAKNRNVKGLGAQRPFDQGVTEAKLAGYALIGKKAPDYVALPALPVERSNLLKAWQEVYHSKAPASVLQSMD